MATGGAKSVLPQLAIFANQPAIKLKPRIQRFIWGQVEFGRLHLSSSKCQTIMSIITADWSRCVMPLIKFYAKRIQSNTSKSFACSDWYHRFCAFTPSQKREMKKQLTRPKCLSEGAIAHCWACISELPKENSSAPVLPLPGSQEGRGIPICHTSLRQIKEWRMEHVF